MGKHTPITVLVAGLGRSGWNVHVNRLKSDSRFKITAAVDRIEDRRQEAQETLGCAVFARLEDALRAKSAELAIICTYSADHATHAIAALEAGCHVVVEKPAALSARELDSEIAAVGKARRILAVSKLYEYPETNSTPFVREIMGSKVLGKILWVKRSGLQFWHRQDWQTAKRLGGGIVNNLIIACMEDYLQLLGSPVARVWGHTRRTVSGGDAEDFAKVSLVGKNGRLVEIEMSYSCATPQAEWMVCGTTGALTVTGETATMRFFDPKLAGRVRPRRHSSPSRSYGVSERLPWQEMTVKVESKRPKADFYDALYRAIREGKAIPGRPESMREAMRVVDLIRRQADTTKNR